MNQREIDDYRKAVTHGTCWTDDTQCNQCTSLPMCNLTKILLDTIEAQQQEIEQLQAQSKIYEGMLLNAIGNMGVNIAREHHNPRIAAIEGVKE
jgi:hypothetical protein